MNPHSREATSKTLLYFLIAWGILNSIQAFFTPLNNDEAYYWMYSKYLDWGYFDHPPMIALMIGTGYFLIHNELGVRLLVIAGQIAAILIIWVLTDKEKSQQKENSLLFIMLVILLPVFNIFGFIATPDAPLILFTAVFLVAYKRFLHEENYRNSLFMGLSMAALVYSKYHGGLLILLVILSNLKLLKSPKFYVASVMAVILFLPHLYWQYINGFPSLQYHLIDRVSGFNPVNVPEYLLNQVLFHNLFLLPLCIWLVIKNRAKNKFDRALNFIFIGFLVFFFIESFRYHIEPQWTAVISIPMIIILFDHLDYKAGTGKYIRWAVLVFLPVILLARAAFMFDFLPVSYLKKEFHNTRSRAKEINNLAGERPVVFTNSYQDPSEFTFYTGKLSHSLNNLAYRKTQYDLWDLEEKVHGKEVLYVPHYITDYIRKNFCGHRLSNGDSVFVKVFKDFQSLQKECVILKDDQYTFSRNRINTINLQIYNPYPFAINLKHKELPVVFQIAFLTNSYMEVKKNLQLPENISYLNAGDTISVDCQFSIDDLPAGIFKVAICSETGVLYDTYNSKFKDVKITE